jgi:excinuclease ABC subunit C
VETPQRGSKKDLVRMAAGNALAVLDEQAARQAAGEIDPLAGGPEELARYLGLAEPPVRIECFDISHIQGAETVASMVVFADGVPNKNEYRRYKLTTVEGRPDDFRSMEEVAGRRYRQGANGGGPLPDLIIIDGGKGQLSSALAVIRQAGLADVPVVGLAKEFEHIFREGDDQPLILPRHSPALYLVQRIRDEAHRFAVTYHRKLRARRNLVSVLDHIAGVGPKRRKALWDHFGSLARIKAAELDELQAVPGISAAVAEAVHNFFRISGLNK